MSHFDSRVTKTISTRCWNRRTELLVLAVFTSLAASLYLFFQPLWSDRSVRWDGANYVAMAQQIAANEVPAADAPFVYRLGFSLLAAILNPDQPVSAMQLISIVSGITGVFLLWIWLTRFPISSVVRIALVAAFALQYHGPLRFGIFFPTLTYSLFWVFLLLGLLTIESALRQKKTSLVVLVVIFLVCLLGTVVRETMIIAPLALLFLRFEARKSARLAFLKVNSVAFSGWVVGVVFTRVFSTATGTYSFRKTAEMYLDQKSLLELTAALFLTFGPLLAVLFASPRQAFELFQQHRELSALLLISVTLAIIGGSNTEFFMFWASPAVFAVIGILLSRQPISLIRGLLNTLLIGAQLVSERVFWNIPRDIENVDIPIVVFSPLQGSSYLQLWSNFASTPILFQVVFTNCVFIVIFVIAHWCVDRKSEKEESPFVGVCPH